MFAPVLYYTAPQDAVYCPELLDDADRARLQCAPQLEQRADWQSSRALKQLLPQPRPPYSLAHKQGHAVLLTGAPVVGIDMEALKQRDFANLLPWFANAAEQRWFGRQSDSTLAFYGLWTFKEALLKALHADFADLPCLNVATPAPQGMRWQRYVWLLNRQWLVSAVLAAPFFLPPPYMAGAMTVQTLPTAWQGCAAR